MSGITPPLPHMPSWREKELHLYVYSDKHMYEQTSSHFVHFLFSAYAFKLQLASLISHVLLKAYVLENYEVKSLCTTCRHTGEWQHSSTHS
jgi:hypothetical protein